MFRRADGRARFSYDDLAELFSLLVLVYDSIRRGERRYGSNPHVVFTAKIAFFVPRLHHHAVMQDDRKSARKAKCL